MRILHVVPTYFPAVRYGGPIVAVHGLCKALVRRGHEVEVFTTNIDGDALLDVPAGVPVELDGVRVSYFPCPVRRIYWSPAMRRRLREVAETFDVIHIHAVFLWPGVAAAREAHRRGTPYVISPRGMLVPALIRAKSEVPKMLWLRLFEAEGFRHAAAIHFTSQLEWSEATGVGLPLPSPFVVPNGVDLSSRPAVPRDSRTLVFLGRLNWKKGIDRVIERLPALPDVRFVVAGNDEERLTPQLIELATRLGVRERVDFHGPVYGPAKDELLARATLFVLPSVSENFGNAVLEALAMETPAVLSRDVGLAEEVVRAGAGIVGLNGIAALLDDPGKREAMGRNGRSLVERDYGWDGVAARMETLYAALRRSRA